MVHGTSGNTTHGMYFTRGSPKNNIYLFGCTGTLKKVLHQLQSNGQATPPNIIENSTRAHIYLKDYALNCTDTRLVKNRTKRTFPHSFINRLSLRFLRFPNYCKDLSLGSYNPQDDISQAAIYLKNSCHKTGKKMHSGIKVNTGRNAQCTKGKRKGVKRKDP